jgi:hypothetical protein
VIPPILLEGIGQDVSEESSPMINFAIDVTAKGN